MDVKEIIKKINDKQNMIVELIIMSCVTGCFVTNLVFRTYKKVENIDYLAETNINTIIIAMILAAVVAGVIYVMDKKMASIVMFVAVFVYSVLSMYENKENIYYAIGLIIISVLALVYVKKDLLYVCNKIKINDKIGLVIVCALGLALIIFIGDVTVLRYKTYSNSTFDFGIFAQMFENMKNTGHPTTTVERPELGSFSHFGVHFSPIYYVMLPFYFVFSSPEAVQIMQAVVLGLAVIPLYYLCRHYKLTTKFSILICALYCLIPATAAGTFYDFHENCCIPVLLLSLILAIEKKKDIWAVVFALLLVMVKEDAAFNLLVLGAYFLLSKRDKKRGAIMSVAALVYFVFAMNMVHSYGIGDLANTRFGNMMYDKEGSLFQIAFSILANPAYAVLQLLDEENFQYFLLMILPVGTALIQKKKYSRYILLGTFVIFNLLPGYAYLHDIGFQYNFGTIVFLIYIAVMTVSEWKADRRNTWIATSVVLTFILFVSFTFPKIVTYRERYKDNKYYYEQMDAAIELVPRNASVLVSGFIMPHLYDVTNLTVIGENVEVTQDYVVVDMRAGYSTDLDIVGMQLQEGYTLVTEVKDTLRVYEKNK